VLLEVAECGAFFVRRRSVDRREFLAARLVTGPRGFLVADLRVSVIVSATT
jgi:hypothetical protein